MSMLWFLSVLKRQLTLLTSKSFHLKWTFTEYKERCLVDGFPSRISSLLAPLLSIVNELPICARFFFSFSCFFFFFRDNEIISMTQERRRGEEPSLPFTPVPLAVLNNDGNQRLLHMGHRCKQARDFTNDKRVSWDESNCALSLCRLRWVWNFFRVLTIKHIPETGPRHNTGSFHKLFWGGCMH